jgi:hypothetical protein
MRLPVGWSLIGFSSLLARPIQGGTTMNSKLTVIATITALTLSTSPVLSQTGGSTAPAGPTSSEALTPPPPTGQDLESMRAMMREMMQEMMGQQSTRAERRWERRPEQRGPARWGHDNRWGRSGPNPHGHMMRGIYGGMGGMHGARMKIMFAVVDANGDGVLALEEVQDFHGRIFNAVDQNGDGGVDMGEIESFFHGSDYKPGPIAGD